MKIVKNLDKTLTIDYRSLIDKVRDSQRSGVTKKGTACTLFYLKPIGGETYSETDTDPGLDGMTETS
jgi:hypothetical protein